MTNTLLPNPDALLQKAITSFEEILDTIQASEDEGLRHNGEIPTQHPTLKVVQRRARRTLLELKGE